MNLSDIIVSKAHEVVLKNFTKDKYVCVRCGLEGDLKVLFGPQRCTPHYELATSGWKDESDE
jgi:hypothetical protein